MDDKIAKIEAFKLRTKNFCLAVIQLFQSMPKTEESKIIGRQLIRSASSVAANYRAACRARSDAEFFSKISIVVEEADESLFWLEVITESNISISDKTFQLKEEATEIVKIVNAIRHQKKK